MEQKANTTTRPAGANAAAARPGPTIGTKVRKPQQPRPQRNAQRADEQTPMLLAQPLDGSALPDFEPVPQKPRHDGWTPDRQRAFIAALADHGSVTQACRVVNIPTKTAYRLRNHPAAGSFRTAWTAALDLGVQRLKDEVYQRALEGQLDPVFIGGKLKGFRRVKSDRLLMFALRMNAKDEYGRRLSATYFDPEAERLHGDSGRSDGGEQSLEYRQARLRGRADYLRETVTGPAQTQAQKDNRNAALVAGFDPVALSMPEIEAMQAALAEAAARHHAELHGPPDQDPNIAFLENHNGEFKPVGPLEELYPLEQTEGDEEWRAGEPDWQDLA